MIRFLKIFFGTVFTLLILIGSCVFYAFKIEPYRIASNQLYLNEKTSDFIKVVQFSDTHIKADFNYKNLDKVVNYINKQNPDVVVFPFMLYEVMQQYIKKNHIHANDYVFQAEQGGAYRIGSFVKRFRTQCKKHKIADCEYVFKTHDYRHTLATQFYDDGVPIQTIRDYLGHVAEEMTKQYVDYMPKKIEKANDNYFDKPENNIALTITPKKRRYRHEKG